jgi:DNA polymerase-1
VPHKPGAVVVSMDFDSQEIRIIADYSKDANMVACLVGENLKSMHSLTGAAILQMRKLRDWSYEVFQQTLEDKTNPDSGLAKEYRTLGKKVNFTTEFGAMAPKLAATLLCSEEEAEVYIKAKEAMFPEVVVWKEQVVAEACRNGFVRDLGGAVRHLHSALTSDDRWVRSKAERQAVNTLVQGSAAQMTKRAEGRMWAQGIFSRYDSVYYGPVHDECLGSVMLADLHRFLPEMHACMVAKFAGMQIPVMSSISFGPNFGDQIEIGLYPTEEAISKGIVEYDKLIARLTQKETT